MTDIAIAFSTFWNSFGLAAYVENSVPDDAEMPYITYTLQQSDWSENGMQQVRVWYQSESFVGINAKVDAIQSRIGRGISLPVTGGLIVISPGSPYTQFQPAEEINQKIAYINLDVQYLC